MVALFYVFTQDKNEFLREFIYRKRRKGILPGREVQYNVLPM